MYMYISKDRYGAGAVLDLLHGHDFRALSVE